MLLNLPDAIFDDFIDTQIDRILASLTATKGEVKKVLKEELSDGEKPLDAAMQDALQAWLLSAQGDFAAKQTAGIEAITG